VSRVLRLNRSAVRLANVFPAAGSPSGACAGFDRQLWDSEFRTADDSSGVGSSHRSAEAELRKRCIAVGHVATGRAAGRDRSVGAAQTSLAGSVHGALRAPTLRLRFGISEARLNYN